MKSTPKTSFTLYRIISTDEAGGSYVPTLPVAGPAPASVKEQPGHPFGLRPQADKTTVGNTGEES